MSVSDLLLEMLQQFHGPKKIIDKTKVENGLIVSTVDTFDYGLETAIITTVKRIHVVERYEDEKSAEIGHKKWVEFAKDGIGKEITAIYFSGEEDKERVKFILK